MTSLFDRTQAAADALVTAAEIALADYGDPTRGDGSSRIVAVQHLATGTVRAVTARLAMDERGAGFTDTDELAKAHLLIAELATQLAEAEAQ